MSKTFASLSPRRAVLAVGGEERQTFLHGLFSCATKSLTSGHGTWGALLTAQGKFLHDAFILACDEVFLLDVEADRLDDLLTRLKRYKLRSKVTLEPRPDLLVAVAWGDDIPVLPAAPGQVMAVAGGWALRDPRLHSAGWRLMLPATSALSALPKLEPAPLARWDAHRIALGLPDGSRDLEIESATLLEHGFAELNGVDFKKGCFVGQEVTARMRYRGLTKKRLMPVTITGPLPAPGTILRTADGADAGEIRSLCLDPAVAAGTAPQGLALVRLAALDAGPLLADGATVQPHRLDWMVFPAEKS